MKLKLKYTSASIGLDGMEGKAVALYDGRNGALVVNVLEKPHCTAAVVVVESYHVGFCLEDNGTKITIEGYVSSSPEPGYRRVRLELI